MTASLFIEVETRHRRKEWARAARRTSTIRRPATAREHLAIHDWLGLVRWRQFMRVAALERHRADLAASRRWSDDVAPALGERIDGEPECYGLCRLRARGCVPDSLRKGT